MIGDATHALRSAMDHLAFQLVKANGKEPTTDTCFPIRDPTKQYTKGFYRKKVEGMSAAAQKLIRERQPCHTGDSTLWNLHQLDIIDKHRLVITTQIAATNWGVDIFSRDGPLLWFDTIDFSLVVGDEITNLPTSTYLSRKHDDYKLALDVAFGKSEIFAGKPVFVTLNHLAKYTRNIVSFFQHLLA